MMLLNRIIWGEAFEEYYPLLPASMQAPNKIDILYKYDEMMHLAKMHRKPCE